MIKFKLTPEPVWVSAANKVFDDSEIGSYPIEERKKVKFKIYPLTPKLIREVGKERLSAENTDELIEETENLGAQDELWDKILLDWRGVLDENGNLISCNRKNKLALVDGGYPKLGVCILRIATELMSKFEKYKKEEEENLKNFSNGMSGDRKT